jgi:preprotein translocase subunit SecD
MLKHLRVFFLIVVVTLVAGWIALPSKWSLNTQVVGKPLKLHFQKPDLPLYFAGRAVTLNYPFKQGLDIQGGVQVVLRADMTGIPEADRRTALDSAKEVIQRRVDLFGVSEPLVQTAQAGNEYRIIVELAGIQDPSQAMQLIGTTAKLDFKLLNATAAAQSASISAKAASSSAGLNVLDQFVSTGLGGQQLKRAVVEFEPKTGQPQVSLQFNDQGKKLFGEITQKHVGEKLGIFLDEFPVALPTVSTPILDGQAVLSGGFTVEQAKQLAIQLNAGALPVPIEILEQRNIGASLGEDAVRKSLIAGVVGIGLVMLFMILSYGFKGVLASVSLLMYAVLTMAVYKTLGVTLTLPGMAGLLLSIGMAVDGNILIFERMKEEMLAGRPMTQAMELGFVRAWNSIKDANVMTLFTALVLINPLDFSFLNSTGIVRGFGITLFVGVLMSLFTGIVVSRTLMRLFLKTDDGKGKS